MTPFNPVFLPVTVSLAEALLGYFWRFFSVSWCPRIDHLPGEKYHDPLVESEWLLCWAIIPAGWQMESSLFILLPYFRNTFSLSLVRIHLLYSVLEPGQWCLFNELTCVRLHPGWVQFRCRNSLPRRVFHQPFIVSWAALHAPVYPGSCSFLAFSS